MISAKQKYYVHCKNEPTISLFSKGWWLDAVCGKNNWDVILVEKGGQIIASMPYYMIKIHGMSIITMPKLTQTMGPWLQSSKANYSNQLAKQKFLITELIGKLPAYDNFHQNFHHSITNWLPFAWQGFCYPWLPATMS